MLEIKVTVEIPGLPESIKALATAISTQSCEAAKADVAKAPEVKQDTANPATSVAPGATTEASAASAIPSYTAPAAPAPAPAASAAPKITIEQISLAGAALASAGRMTDLMAIVAKHGVQALTQLKPEQYEAVAADLRALGAQI